MFKRRLGKIFTIFNHSKVWNPLEFLKSGIFLQQEELYSISWLDLKFSIFVQIFAFIFSIKSEMNQLKLATSLLREKKTFRELIQSMEEDERLQNFIACATCLEVLTLFANRFIRRISSMVSKFYSWNSLHKKLELYANRFGL